MSISDRTSPSCDVAVLTALPEEREAVLAYIDSPVRVTTGERTSYRGRVGDASVVVRTMHGMGNTRAASVAREAISVWNPAVLMVVGLTGGLHKGDDMRLGDVLIADQVVGYELQKIGEGDASQHRYEVYRSSADLLDVAHGLTDDGGAGWAAKIKVKRPDGGVGPPGAHTGVFLSGEKVVADSSFLNPVRASWGSGVAVEMEAFGAALAVYQASEAPRFIVVKGICDWADELKNDGWREYASHAASAFAASLIRNLGLTPAAERSQPTRNDVPLAFPGPAKVEICRRLGQDWPDLADWFEIPSWSRARFERGREPQGVWEWLEDRGKLNSLVDGLRAIDRSDLAETLIACLLREPAMKAD